MTKKIKLIITADDYGLSKEVDQATLEAIRAGSITTVSVMMNFDRSEQALKDLLTTLDQEELLNKIGIGVHLNITTGYAITEDRSRIQSIVNKKRRFRKFDYYKIITSRQFVKKNHALCEIKAQIDRFLAVLQETKLEKSDPVVLDHFTSQNNVLHQIPKLSEAIADVSEDYCKYGKYPNHPIPVRRPTPMLLENNEDKLVKGIIDYLSTDTKKYLLSKVNTKLIKGTQSLLYRWFVLNDYDLTRIMKTFNEKKIKMPHSMFFSFYAMPPIYGELPREVEKKLDILKASLTHFWHVAVDKRVIECDEPYFIEIVHHLGTGEENPDLDHLRDESNLDVEYLESHSLFELNLVKSDAYKELLEAENVTLATYSDLNAGHEQSGAKPPVV